MNLFKNIEFGRLLDNFAKLKYNISDWIVAVDTKQYEAEKRLRALQAKISDLEQEMQQLRIQNGR